MKSAQPKPTSETSKQKYLEENVRDTVRDILADIVAKRPDDVLGHVIAYCEARLGVQSPEPPRPITQLHTEEAEPVLAAKSQNSAPNALTPQKKKTSFKPDAKVTFELDEDKENGRVTDVKKKSLLGNEINPSHETLPSRLSSFTSNSDEEISDTEFNKKYALARPSEAAALQIRLGISAEASNAAREIKGGNFKAIKKSEDERKLIIEYLSKSILFSQLDQKDKEKVADAMEIHRYPKGKVVIKQGDTGNHLYIVSEGFLRCTKTDPQTKEEVFLVNYIKGNVFGELSLLYNSPRAATIEAQTDSVVYSLDRETFNSIVRAAVMMRHQLFKELVEKVDILKPLSQTQKDKICDCLVVETFQKSDYVISEGQEADKLYFILEGTAEVLKKNAKGVREKVFEYGPNQYFGELALINNDRRSASIKITSKTAKLATLDKDSFSRLLGDLKDILRQNSFKYDKSTPKTRGK